MLPFISQGKVGPPYKLFAETGLNSVPMFLQSNLNMKLRQLSRWRVPSLNAETTFGKVMWKMQAHFNQCFF